MCVQLCTQHLEPFVWAGLLRVHIACRELEVAAYGVGGAAAAAAAAGEKVGGADIDPLLADIHSEYSACMQDFRRSTEVGAASQPAVIRSSQYDGIC